MTEFAFNAADAIAELAKLSWSDRAYDAMQIRSSLGIVAARVASRDIDAARQELKELSDGQCTANPLSYSGQAAVMQASAFIDLEMALQSGTGLGDAVAQALTELLSELPSSVYGSTRGVIESDLPLAARYAQAYRFGRALQTLKLDGLTVTGAYPAFPVVQTARALARVADEALQPA